MVEYKFKSFISIGSDGGFKKGNKDLAEVRYYYPTEDFPTPKISIKLSTLNQQNVPFEVKSFRVQANTMGDLEPFKSLFMALGRVLGYSMSKMDIYDKENQMDNISIGIATQVKDNIKNGFIEGLKDA